MRPCPLGLSLGQQPGGHAEHLEGARPIGGARRTVGGLVALFGCGDGQDGDELRRQLLNVGRVAVTQRPDRARHGGEHVAHLGLRARSRSVGRPTGTQLLVTEPERGEPRTGSRHRLFRR